MSNKIAQILSVLFTVFVAAVTVFMYVLHFQQHRDEVLWIAIIFSVFTIALAAFTVMDVIIGRRKYFFKNGDIFVSRKGNIIRTINKSTISDAALVGAYIAKGFFFTFMCEGAKYIIFVDKDKIPNLKRSFSGIKIDALESTSEYIKLFVSELFSI